MIGVMWSGIVFFLTAPILFVLILRALGPVPGNPGASLLRSYAGTSLPALICAGGWWFFYRRQALGINRVAVAEDGLYPPFKPKQRLSKSDWFVEYKDVVSMRSVTEPDLAKVGISVFDVSLKDGLKFQLNPLDLLVYVGEEEVKKYAVVLRGVQEELESPLNRDRASRGETVTIPRHLLETAKSELP